MTIQLFVTGGTFDKDYDEIKGVLYFNETNVPEMLRLGRCRASVEITRASQRNPPFHSSCDKRWMSIACTPG